MGIRNKEFPSIFNFFNFFFQFTSSLMGNLNTLTLAVKGSLLRLKLKYFFFYYLRRTHCELSLIFN